ncbi:MAG: rhomboid family intramembrane serine protease [Bacillota bacterium]
MKEQATSTKPPMTFMRGLLMFLCGIGLLLPILVGISAIGHPSEGAVIACLVMAAIFGVPFWMALTARPRAWFSPYDSPTLGMSKENSNRIEPSVLSQTELETKNGHSIATLKVKRPSGFFTQDVWGEYAIVIDGQEAGFVGRGKEVVFQLAPGEHAIEVQKRGKGSPTLQVTLKEGETHQLSCGYAATSMELFRASNEYLWLREEPKHPPKKVGFVKSTREIVKMVPVTSAIIVLLCAVFVLEMCFHIGPLEVLSPNIRTLVAFGGLYHPAISGGEWWRLFSPVLLHASVIHLLLNCYALLLAGMLLENYIGRIWYLVMFLLGGLGGSLMSLALNPATLISVGASGAIMALFGAALATSFHLPADANRKRYQLSLVQILVFSLLPFLGAGHGQHIDISAHLGGAITGSILGGILVLFWPHRGKLKFQKAGLALSLIFVAGYAYAEVPVVEHYKSFVLGAETIPDNQVPKSDEEARKNAKELLTDYPHDPRSHLYMSIVYMSANNMADAERELRAGLAEDEMLRLEFQPGLKVHMEGMLAMVLQQRGETDEAKRYAASLCASDGKDQLRQNLVNSHLCD